MTAMVDLAKTPAEVKKEVADMTMPAMPASSKPSVAEYPYGLCISIEDETLKKLGLDGDLPAAGEMLHFVAMAKVTNASEQERLDSDGKPQKCCRVELQIVQMGLIGPPEDRASKWYGAKSDGDADDE